MKHNTQTITTIFVTLILSLFLIFSCHHEGDEDANIGERFIHLSPTDSNYDIQIKEGDLVTDFVYGLNTGYYEADDDDVNITFTEKKSGLTFSKEKWCDEEENYTFFLMDDDEDSVIVAKDEKERTYNMAQVRFVNAVKEATAIDFTLMNNQESVGTILDYKNVSLFYDKITPGYWSIFAKEMGSADPSGIAQLNDVFFGANENYTVIVSGTRNGTDKYDVKIKIFKDTEDGAAEANAQLQLINASPDVGPIDIYQNDHLLFKDLNFKASTGYINGLDGKNKITVFKAGGNTEEKLFEEQLFFEGGKHFSLIALDTEEHLTMLRLEDDLTEPKNGESSVRFIHAVPDIARVTVKESTVQPPLFLKENIPFGRSDDQGVFTPLVSKNYVLAIHNSENSEILLNNQPMDLTHIKQCSFVVSGFKDPLKVPEMSSFMVEHRK